MSRQTLQVDTLVIGSGAGGAPVACRLAEAGRDVMILEEGKDWRAPDFTQRERQMAERLFRDQGGQATDDFAVKVLQGSCVGGSTVVNMGDVVPMTDAVIEHWRQQYAFPFQVAELQAPLQRALDTLQAARIPDHEVNRNGRILLEGARKLGWRAEVLDDNRVGCVGSGYCMAGCAYDAKKSMITNYIPRALAAGARLLDNAYAVRLLFRQGRCTGVEVQRRPGGRHPGPVGMLRVEAKDVVVACGAIHSPMLLMRSRYEHPALGKNLSLQPQNMVLGRFKDPVIGFRGIPQSTYVEEFFTADADRGLGGFVLESIMVPPANLAAGFAPPGVGREATRRMQMYPNLAGCFVLVPDQPVGEVGILAGNRADISYRFTLDVRETMWRGIQRAAELFLEAGALEVFVVQHGIEPVRNHQQLRALADGAFAPIIAPTISAHPQGTMRLSADPAQGLVDADFRVRGLANVYVCDTSLFPTTSSTHTMTPTITLGEFFADRYLAGISG